MSQCDNQLEASWCFSRWGLEFLPHTLCGVLIIEHKKWTRTFYRSILSDSSLRSRLVTLFFMVGLVLKYHHLCVCLQNVNRGWSAAVCIDRQNSQGTRQTRASEWKCSWHDAWSCSVRDTALPLLLSLAVAFSAMGLRPPLDLPLNEGLAATIEKLITECRSRQRAQSANVTWTPPWAG